MADDVCYVLRMAVLSRSIVLLLQFVVNNVIRDYDTSSSIGTNNNKLFDKPLHFVLQGFSNWDSMYFLQIAKDGYQYEQYMAFFPLYPLLIRFLSSPVDVIFGQFISYTSILLLIGWSISCVCFILAAVVFYKLTLLVFQDTRIALFSSVLFCINPASVFMCSVYTESIFACCLFAGLYLLAKSSDFSYTLLASVAFAFGSASRSNGVISCGFVTHVLLKQLLSSLFHQIQPVIIFHPGLQTWKQRLSIIISTFYKLVVSNLIIVAPFFLYQYYGYLLYCHDTQVFIPPWCDKTIPLSYSYIQDHYWNVGFLRYFEVKQIPNFILALPMVVLCLSAVVEYFQSRQTIFMVKTLGLWRNKNNSKEDQSCGKSSQENLESGTEFHSPDIFVYIVHLLFLTVFAVTSIHVQVLTRMIASSSPVVYWYTAHLLVKQTYSGCTRLVLGYFLSYFAIGVILHCNFYPWT